MIFEAPPRWAAILMLAAWLIAAGPVRAADDAGPTTNGNTATKAGNESPPSAPQTGTAQPAPTQPAGKPPDRPKAKTRPKQTFRPSEEIHVDKAVDFPADI